ncbi:hypothetical protein FSARC_7384 [Fusarium sarcochroum]|uniref:Uncharacterized protein n=1 Tax=Fusarium sarcochroum TaxID=1208366 RepID=A0A8H4TV42_9HYPO|nr:hypothetical protein FSARC_7384 [Fusarium sarcochroum]
MKILIFLFHISTVYGTCNWYYGQWQPDPGQCFELVMNELGISRQLVQYMNPGRNIDIVSDDEIYNVPFSIGALKSAKWTTDCPPRLVLQRGAICEDGANKNSRVSHSGQKSTTAEAVSTTTDASKSGPQSIHTADSTLKEDDTPSTTSKRTKGTGKGTERTSDGDTSEAAVSTSTGSRRATKPVVTTVNSVPTDDTSTKSKNGSKYTTSNSGISSFHTIPTTTTKEETDTPSHTHSTDQITTISTVKTRTTPVPSISKTTSETASQESWQSYGLRLPTCLYDKSLMGRGQKNFLVMLSIAGGFCNKSYVHQKVMKAGDECIIYNIEDGINYELKICPTKGCPAGGQVMSSPLKDKRITCTHIFAYHIWGFCEHLRP